MRRSVRSVRGNQWMFRIGHPADHPLRLRPELLQRSRPTAPFPILREAHAGAHGPVAQRLERHLLPRHGLSRRRAGAERLDRPGGARARRGAPQPPVEAYFRVIDEPVLRLASIDLGATADITTSPRCSTSRSDYLGLLKAAVIAVGHRAARAWKARRSRWPTCWPRWSGPGCGIEIVSKRQRHPEGLAPGGFDQPAGVPDRRLHARHRPGRSR